MRFKVPPRNRARTRRQTPLQGAPPPCPEDFRCLQLRSLPLESTRRGHGATGEVESVEELTNCSRFRDHRVKVGI